MCEYSLESYRRRNAIEGETLITQRFPSGTQGFISPGSPRVAVCLIEGTQVLLRDIPEDLQKKLGTDGEAVTTFTYLKNPPRRWISFVPSFYYYHDGLQFPNGKQILINDLPEGLEVDVLSYAVTSMSDVGKAEVEPVDVLISVGERR